MSTRQPRKEARQIMMGKGLITLFFLFTLVCGMAIFLQAAEDNQDDPKKFLPGQLGEIFSVTIDPQNPAVIYAVGGRGLFKSIDSGRSWTRRLGSRITGIETVDSGDLVISPENSDILYAVMNDQSGISETYFNVYIYRSLNGGSTWTLILYEQADEFGELYIKNLSINPANPANLYMLKNRGGLSSDLFRSTDGGDTFIDASFSAACLKIAPQKPLTIYAGVDVSGQNANPKRYFSGAVKKSTDGGKTWISLVSHVQGFSAARSLVIDPDNPDLIGTDRYLTHDGGQSWTCLPALIRPLAIDSRSRIYAAEQASERPYWEPNVERNGLFVSANLGQSWKYSGLNGIYINSMAIDPLTSLMVAASPEGVILPARFDQFRIYLKPCPSYIVGTVPIEVGIPKGSICEIKIYIDNQLQTTLYSPTHKYQWNSTPFASGYHRIKAVAVDDSQRTSMDQLWINVAN